MPHQPYASPLTPEDCFTPRAARRRALREDRQALARPNPTPGESRAHRREHGGRGDVALTVHARRPWPRRHRFDGQLPGTAETTPRSGQARINAKRIRRAEFWAAFARAVRIRVSAEVEPYLRQHLSLCDGADGAKARVTGRYPVAGGFGMVDLAVHVPGAPEGAVRAEPLFEAVRRGEQYVPRLIAVEWFGPDGQRIAPERERLAWAAR